MWRDEFFEKINEGLCRNSIMYIQKLLNLIENTLPAKTAMEGDKIGLQIHSGKEQADRLLVTMELNDEVINEAVELSCDCVITFHPLIFSPLTYIHESERVGRLCIKLIQNSISLIVIHTNFDSYSQGTSTILAEKLGLDVTCFLEPDSQAGNYGMGVIATAGGAIEAQELLDRVSILCSSPVRYCNGKGSLLEKIAIVGGSGSSFINSAMQAGCDALITADVSYHKFHQADKKMMIIDPGHYEMEQFVPSGLSKLIKTLDKDSEIGSVLISKIHTNPVNYYPLSADYITKQKNYLINNKVMV